MEAMRAELEMLSSMGSNWASATLGYLCLLPCFGAATDAQRAIDLCSRPARERDPYALFVLGWAIYLYTRDRSRAAVPMFESSKMGFVPATLAMVFFVWPSAEAMLRFLDAAGRGGHKAAWASPLCFLSYRTFWTCKTDRRLSLRSMGTTALSDRAVA